MESFGFHLVMPQNTHLNKLERHYTNSMINTVQLITDDYTLPFPPSNNKTLISGAKMFKCTKFELDC